MTFEISKSILIDIWLNNKSYESIIMVWTLDIEQALRFRFSITSLFHLREDYLEQ